MFGLNQRILMLLTMVVLAGLGGRKLRAGLVIVATVLLLDRFPRVALQGRQRP